MYPVEIKMTGNPNVLMGKTNLVLDKISGKKRGMGAVVCMVDKKTFLSEDLVALPVGYI